MFEKIKFIRKTKKKRCYDVKMNNCGLQGKKMVGIKSNFVANDIVCKNSGGDARASFSLSDTFEEFEEAKQFKIKYPEACDVAVKLEGAIRHKGVHAAAMVVAEKDVSSYLPINKVGGVIVTEWEKQLVEDIKLIKFDILGLKTLSIINDAIKSANIELPKEFNDKKVYETVFKDANTTGIFQLGTVGMQKFSSQLNISEFSDLCDATTLFRPAALHTGQALVYANRKNGKEPIAYLHRTLEPITNKTRGVILYQEQIMQVMNQVAGLSWATAEMARKVITKSKGKDAFNKMRQDFVIGAKNKNNLNQEEAEKLFDIVSNFGSYSFNKAHAVEYSIISYYCAWLKTYYPKYFYKSLLKYETEESEIKNYTLDMYNNGIFIEYPEINKSDFSYTIVDDKIYAGLNSVVGIGEKVVTKIKEHRPYMTYKDFKKRCKVSDNLNKGLIVAEAFRNFNINKRLCYEDKEDDNVQTKLFQPEKLDIREFDDVELSQLVLQHTNLTPKLDVKKSFDFGDFNFTDISQLKKQELGKQYYIRGLVTDVINKDKLLRAGLDKHEHHFEKHMIYLNLNDGTGNLACQLSPETYEKYNKLIENIKKQPIVVFGTMNSDNSKMYVDLLQIVSKNDKTTDIDDFKYNVSKLKSEQGIITSARPAVSKAGKSYYRIKIHDGTEGLCFRFDEKLFPGMICEYWVNQPPFINLKVVS